MSDDRNRPWALEQLRSMCDLNLIRSAVDVGAGMGGWRQFCGPWMPACSWTAIEIHEPYSERFRLPSLYSGVIIADVRELDPLPRADLYFLGDMLEHMEPGDSVRTWNRVREACWRVILGIPVEYTPQGECLGNPHEAHLSHWSVEGIYAEMTGITGHIRNDWNGTFIGQGLLPAPGEGAR